VDGFAFLFDYLEHSFSYKEVQLKIFCLAVKTSCPLTENVDETPVNLRYKVFSLVDPNFKVLFFGSSRVI